MLTLLSLFAWTVATVAWLTLVAPVGDTRLVRPGPDRANAGWNGTPADTSPLGAARWRPAQPWAELAPEEAADLQLPRPLA